MSINDWNVHLAPCHFYAGLVLPHKEVRRPKEELCWLVGAFVENARCVRIAVGELPILFSSEDRRSSNLKDPFVKQIPILLAVVRLNFEI